MQGKLPMHLSPRCGARSKRTGEPCQSAAMKNGRCRMSSLRKLWRKLSRGGNGSPGGFVAAARGRDHRLDRTMPGQGSSRRRCSSTGEVARACGIIKFFLPARRSRGRSSDRSTSHLVGFKLDFRVEVPGELLHRAVARETRHVQRRHLGVARTSHDTRYELLADAAATPARLDAEGRFHGRASSAFGAAYFCGAARHASSESLTNNLKTSRISPVIA
jgi:hypothetical protein